MSFGIQAEFYRNRPRFNLSRSRFPSAAIMLTDGSKPESRSSPRDYYQQQVCREQYFFLDKTFSLINILL